MLHVGQRVTLKRDTLMDKAGSVGTVVRKYTPAHCTGAWSITIRWDDNAHDTGYPYPLGGLIEPIGPPSTADRVVVAFAGIEPHLDIVLCRVDGGYHPWVTWVYNYHNGGFHHGHYFETQEEARADYRERIARAWGRVPASTTAA